MKVLFVDACARGDSRTRKLAERFLKGSECLVKRVDLYAEGLMPLDEEGIMLRDNPAECEKENQYGYAKDLKDSDLLVFAAPYWDLSFPSVLKTYLEAVNVPGVTFRYNEDGMPESLCRAEKMVYFSTSGGPMTIEEYGFGYVDALCRFFYGIKDTRLIKAENLDVIGVDVNAKMEDALSEADRLKGEWL